MLAYWLNEESRTFLSRGYLQPGQSAEDRIRQIALRAEEILGRPGFSKKLEDYVHAGFISFASPVWSNFGSERGLPISCNNSHFSDTTESILFKTAEIGMMTKYGAGTSAYLGDLRPRGSPISRGGYSQGPVHFAEHIQSAVNIISQGQVRRGAAAVYLPVEHPDIMEFLNAREEGHPIQHLSLGVCITDAWMEDMIAKDTEKRKIWLRILKKRFETGYPYIFFTDTVNRGAPQVYKDHGIKINASNLCSEIALASNEEWSFVCDLSSLNALHYDEWKYTDLVETTIAFLDAVMEEYIVKTTGIPFMYSAWKFARDQRALGLGTLGWHSYLQSNHLAFDSPEAMERNKDIHEFIRGHAENATAELAFELGEPPLLEGYGRRNVTLMAIAPTTSSSFILGQVSPSIEPLDSNYFTKDLQKGKFTYRNPYLSSVLSDYGFDNEETWRSILLHGGSVQHLDFMSPEDKAVFKTFGEIDQTVIVNQAADRQQFIDQSQSLNLKIHPDTPIKDVNALMIHGWRRGVKTFYYQRSTNPSQEFVRELISCAACEA